MLAIFAQYWPCRITDASLVCMLQSCVSPISSFYFPPLPNLLGVNFMEKTIALRKTDITFSIWDLGGQQEYLHMLPLVCNDAIAILFMFDLSVCFLVVVFVSCFICFLAFLRTLFFSFLISSFLFYFFCFFLLILPLFPVPAILIRSSNSLPSPNLSSFRLR